MLMLALSLQCVFLTLPIALASPVIACQLELKVTLQIMLPIPKLQTLPILLACPMLQCSKQLALCLLGQADGKLSLRIH